VEDNRISRVRKACANGRGVFLDYDPTPGKPVIDGREAEWEDAIAEAAKVLARADSPLIYGLSSSACEAQRKAIALADLIGAIVDTTSSVCHGPTGLAMQAVGEPTSSLGEIRNRADLLIFWGCNPAAAHLRHFERYSLNAEGTLVPNGRRDRTMIVFDVRPTATSKAADEFFQVLPDGDFEVLAVLRALVQGKRIGLDSVGGIPLERLRDLTGRMKKCRYGVFFMGMGLTMSRARDLNVRELFSLTAQLNEFTRFTVMPMRGHGNVAGADQVLTWLSGYPFAVSFARGYPQYGPGEFSAVDVLVREEADAALILASDPAAHFPRAAAMQLKRIPTIVIDPMLNLTAETAHVYFPTCCYGVDAEGVSYRMDNVPIRLRGALPTVRPTDESILDSIIEAVKRC
jgi:formylmethanofuran dehydrogenase subunit B